jgi:chemotaxis protein CheD
MIVRTILGSCVAVCLWDPVARVGGINHFLLPRPPRGSQDGNRFGTGATRSVIEQAVRLGAELQRLRAILVGAGYPVHGIDPQSIGDANRAIALQVLAAYGVRVVREDTGGACGRKLTFDTGTGRLAVCKVRALNQPGHVGG